MSRANVSVSSVTLFFYFLQIVDGEYDFNPCMWHKEVCSVFAAVWLLEQHPHPCCFVCYISSIFTHSFSVKVPKQVSNSVSNVRIYTQMLSSYTWLIFRESRVGLAVRIKAEQLTRVASSQSFHLWPHSHYPSCVWLEVTVNHDTPPDTDTHTEYRNRVCGEGPVCERERKRAWICVSLHISTL